MFEALIRDIAARFGLGENARELLTAVLASVFDERSGGFSGAFARFRQAGFGDLFHGWLGSAEPAPVTPAQLEAVFGPDLFFAIARRIDAPHDVVINAAAAMLPYIVAGVTPTGEVPSGVPAGVNGYLSGVVLPGDVYAMNGPRGGTPGLGAVKWPLIAAVALALGYCVLNG